MLIEKEDLEKRIKFLESENEKLRIDNINNNNKNTELLNLLSIGVFYCDKEGNITGFNDKFLEILGAAKEKIKQLNIFNDLKNIEVVNEIKKALNTGKGSYRGFYKPITGTKEIYSIGEFRGVRDGNNNIISCVCTVEDVTDDYNYRTNLSKVDLKYERSEQNYKSTFLSVPVPIVIHQNGIVKLVNDAALVFGNIKKIDDVVGGSVMKFIHKNSIEETEANINFVLSGGKSKIKNYTYKTVDGEPRDVISKSSLFFIDDNPAVLLSFMDITKYKKNEEKLNVIFKGIETSPASVVITDSKGYIEYVNPKFTEITGYTEKDAIGQNSQIFYLSPSIKKMYNRMKQAITSGVSWRSEMQNTKKTGEIFWEYVIVSPIKNNKGEITNYIAIKEDITRRKEIENKLVKNEKYFKTLFETAPDGIFEINKEGIITNCNKEFANSVHSTKLQIIGKSAKLFITDTDKFNTLFNDLIIKGSIESELIQQNVDGTTTEVWRKVSSIYDKDNNFIGALIYSRDISKIKETEQLLIDAKNKAEESDELKSAFLSNMSHEIRTPLNAIVGFSKLISKNEINLSEKKKFTEYININSKLLLNLINDIVDISKIEANQLSINKHNFILNDLLLELEIMYNSQIKKTGKKIDLVLNMPFKNLTIHSDELRLKQILINLLTNSVKFTKEGTIRFGFNIEDGRVIIYVKDSGIGIPSDKLKTVFNRFVRIRNAGFIQKGTGLGLAIVDSLVDLLGGNITVKSLAHKGTEFTVTFPVSVISNTNTEKEVFYDINSKIIDWSNKTILIAEDDEFNFVVLSELLKDFKINIIHAVNGKEAVDLYLENINEIDIVLMDIQMPIVDGYSATKQILQINNNAKVIAQTAFAMSDEKRECLKAGCIGFVTKPIDIKQLIQLLSNYL